MTARQRILLLVTLSEWGGAQHIVYLLATHLRSSYEITVTCGPGGELVNRLKEEGIRVVQINGLRRFPHPCLDLRALWQLYRLMRQERFNLVHIHSTKAGLLGRLAARLAGVTCVIFTAHGWAFTEGRIWWKRRILGWYERLMAKFTTKIICVSEHDRQLALRFRVARPEKLVVVHNGLDPEQFVGIDREKMRDELGIGEAPVMTFIGRLAPPKDLATLLAAMKVIPSGLLLLVGDGPLRVDVEKVIKKEGLTGRVSLMGSRRDVPAILAASDVLVLPSRWEGLPLTIIEAMLAGVAVVATRVGGVPELVDEGVTGLLVPRTDPASLAAALRRLIEDKELRVRMGETGRAKALTQFTLERMLTETREQYETD